ncbi:MAG TPA: hypothetical protein VGK35_03010 [Actinotalea sp.]
MTQTLHAPAAATSARAASPWVLELHGYDPQTGHLATWHVSPILNEGEPSGMCTVERVAGDITHPAVWMQATKESSVVTQDEVFALVRTVATRH